MFTLGAGLEALQSLFDTVINTCVVTDFKMQAVIIFITAPVPAIQGVAALKADSACDDPGLVSGEYRAQPM